MNVLCFSDNKVLADLLVAQKEYLSIWVEDGNVIKNLIRNQKIDIVVVYFDISTYNKIAIDFLDMIGELKHIMVLYKDQRADHEVIADFQSHKDCEKVFFTDEHDELLKYLQERARKNI